MFPSDSRKMRPERRARRRTTLAALERLESRDLMAYNPLGFSVPDLRVTGSAGTRAAWGGPLGVIATVINQGSSTITNPIAQAPGAITTADAPASTISVVITPRRSMAHGVTIGTFKAPPVTQNNVEQIAESFTLPARPRGFPRGGGHVYVHLVVNGDQGVVESDLGNNLSQPLPVQLTRRALPQLVATQLSLPSTLNPGDTIEPVIGLSNLGTAPTNGPVTVALVASTTPNFTVGSSIVALYDITSNIPAASQVPPGGLISAFSQTANPPNNVVTFTGLPVTLPTSPRKYYLGLVVDPYGKIPQLGTRRHPLALVRTVGPNRSGLPPAGVIQTPTFNPFPIPASGTFVGINPTTNTTNSTIV